MSLDFEAMPAIPDKKTGKDPREAAEIKNILEDPRSCITKKEAVLSDSVFLNEEEKRGEEKKLEKEPVDERKVAFARSMIEQEIAKKKDEITMENCMKVFEEIAVKVRNNKFAGYEGVEEEVDFYMQARYAALNEEIREKVWQDPEERKKFVEYNKANSRWMNSMGSFLKENRDNPVEIANLWKRIGAAFSISPLGRAIGERFKYGVLAQRATEILIMDSAKDFIDSDISVEIVSATEEEDVLQQVDFWIVASRGDSTKKIPCQVKSFNLHGKSQEETKDRNSYARRNIINFSIPDNTLLNFKRNNDNKMKAFFKQHNEGILITVPYFGSKVLKDNGEMNDETQNVFRQAANCLAFQRRLTP